MPTQRQKAEQQFNVEAFMAEMAPKESIDFYGVTIPVPTDTPLSVTLQLREQQQSSEEASQQNILEILTPMLGQEIADQIEQANPGVRACGVLLLWCYKNGSGVPTTFPEAYEEFCENESSFRDRVEDGDSLAEAGKALSEQQSQTSLPQPNRAQRRATTNGRVTQSGKKSAGTSR